MNFEKALFVSNGKTFDKNTVCAMVSYPDAVAYPQSWFIGLKNNKPDEFGELCHFADFFIYDMEDKHKTLFSEPMEDVKEWEKKYWTKSEKQE